MAEDYTAALHQFVVKLAPHRLLCLGAHCARLLPPLPVASEVVTLPLGAWDALERLGRFDLSLVDGEALEALPKPTATRLLARLRDLHGGRLLLLRPAQAGDWSATELLALGLVRLHRFADMELYGFDIHSYKTTPDWLNPSYWAHPERWGQAWW